MGFRFYFFSLLCAGLLRGPATAECCRVRLMQEAAVRGESVYLSDFLPDRASPRLRAVAGTVRICRAPEVASRRQLPGAVLERALAARPDISRQLIFPQEVSVYRTGWPLERQALRSTIAAYLEHLD